MTINYTSWAEYLQAAADERREVQGIEPQIARDCRSTTPITSRTR